MPSFLCLRSRQPKQTPSPAAVLGPSLSLSVNKEASWATASCNHHCLSITAFGVFLLPSHQNATGVITAWSFLGSACKAAPLPGAETNRLGSPKQEIWSGPGVLLKDSPQGRYRRVTCLKDGGRHYHHAPAPLLKAALLKTGVMDPGNTEQSWIL